MSVNREQVNAGAILIMSLLQRHIQPDMSMASKFDYLLNYYRRSPPLYVIIDTPLYIPPVTTAVS